jgi:hypothetical protein
MAFLLTPNMMSIETQSSPYQASAETVAPMSMSAENFTIPTSVFASTNTHDRIEFFDRFAIGDSRMNMKLVSELGRDIPAYYSPASHGRKGSEVPLDIEWSGSERLDGVDKFSYNRALDEISMNGQTFTKLSPLRM